ncbi:MAG: adenylate/guanylate cyclase domain-containing protein [Candidatus Afipia apatlaquensis]|uniref:Adenylate/guanylate cyclase domain-containing protein n=1 Tax=Candidatus Afipia apatlaquensis TaxID=2712852 RepID=A0A7C9VHX4_9BRAD|nr:adenylate/guanylate cyclase domain-containing protein [Candidatus Afipia apatlaquensis]
MDARSQRKLRFLTAILGTGALGGIIFVIARVGFSPSQLTIGIIYGVLISGAIGTFELLASSGPLRDWLGSLPFTTSLAVRSAFYAAVIIPVQYFDLGVLIAGLTPNPNQNVWTPIIFSAVFAIALNLLFAITNIIGPRAFLHLVTGRYHTPVEESRFVLFVDIAGSTTLAERLGGLGIHSFLDKTFRSLTGPIIDCRGEVLNYVGDEIIVTWSEASGAIDCRPLRCFLAMRDTLQKLQSRFEKEFGVAPRIRGSLHFGPVIVGEIGDIKRAIVFNGDVMNTAARLEELSRNVEGGFVASRAAIQQFKSALPAPLHDLGVRDIRGKSDGLAVMGLA